MLIQHAGKSMTTSQIFAPIVGSDAFRDNEKTNWVVYVLDCLQLIVMRTEVNSLWVGFI
jgi:hypothetical protein